MISSIDWSATTNKIVTCSHDRNAFVWTYNPDTNIWTPALVILRIDRAAIDVKWSACGKKFAVASGSKCISICTYEETNDWWVCKMIKKKFKSSVLSVAFHPTNSQLLACGSSDFKARVLSTYSSDIDGEGMMDGGDVCFFREDFSPDYLTITPEHVPEMKKRLSLPFGEAYLEIPSIGWVHDIAWSPSGDSLAFCSHDGEVHEVNFKECLNKFFSSNKSEIPNKFLQFNSLKYTGLMMNKLIYLSNDLILTTGYDMNPALFIKNTSTNLFKYHSFLDRGIATKEEEVEGTVSAARSIFRSKTIRGQEKKSEGDELKTNHDRMISKISLISPSKFSTCGYDGKVIVWDFNSLDVDMKLLKL